VNLLVSGDPEKGKATAEQETLATSISRLTALLGKAQAYVEDVVVSSGRLPCLAPSNACLLQQQLHLASLCDSAAA
jgi:hypothetical protein